MPYRTGSCAPKEALDAEDATAFAILLLPMLPFAALPVLHVARKTWEDLTRKNMERPPWKWGLREARV